VETTIQIDCADGRRLAASLFGEPRVSSPAVVVAGATGVCRGLYRRFAEFLATRGAAVVTFDYRGVGGSRQGSLRRDAACLSDWGRLDLSAVLAWARGALQPPALYVVAHSVGGQLLPLVARSERIEAVVYVAAQEVYWGNWPLPLGLAFLALCHAVMPGLVHATGFLPARMLRLGEDLPPGVGLEWARWARTRDYLQRAPFFDRLACPALAYDFADDALAPRRAVDRLLASQPRLVVRRRHLSPRDLALARVGHFGFFRRDLSESLWRESSDWLRVVARNDGIAEVAS
jgi:predicted alpha/beta hydrolase